MAVLTFIRFPTNSIITKEQLEGIVDINENRLTEMFKRTFLSGVMADDIDSNVLKPSVIPDGVGSVVDFSISQGVGIIGSGYMIILESAFTTSTDFSVNGNKTLFIKFSQDWSDDITTIQKPTGNIIQVSKIQLQDSDILEWVDFDPTTFVAGEISSHFPIGKLIYDGQIYKFKLDDGYRRIYIPNIRYPEKNYNISPSVTVFCSLFEFLSCRGGDQRAITNPFGLGTRNVGNLLETFASFIVTAGVVNLSANDLFVQIGATSSKMKILTGTAISANGKYMRSSSMYEEDISGDADGTYYVYIHAIEDSDGYDTFEFVKSLTAISSNDYVLLANVSILSGAITSVEDQRSQLALLGGGVTPATYYKPPKHPGPYLLEKNFDSDRNEYDVVTEYGDEFDGQWANNNLFEMKVDHGWEDGDWDEPPAEEETNPWYLHVVSDGIDQRYKILSGISITGGGIFYRFTLDGDCGYGSFPVNGEGQIVAKADLAVVDYKKDGEDEYTSYPAVFEGGWSYEKINVKGLKPDTNYDLRIRAFKNGIASLMSDVSANLIPFHIKSVQCKASKTTDQVIGHATITKIDFNVIDFDPYNRFNLSTDTFTVPRDGKYLIIFQVMWEDTEPQLNGRLLIKKNGTKIASTRRTIDYFTPPISYDYQNQALETILDLTENDEITFHVNQYNDAYNDVKIKGFDQYDIFVAITSLY